MISSVYIKIMRPKNSSVGSLFFFSKKCLNKKPKENAGRKYIILKNVSIKSLEVCGVLVIGVKTRQERVKDSMKKIMDI